MTWLFIVTIILAMIFLTISNFAKDSNKILLWPEYFDKSLPKSSGRRVPLKFATNNPTVEEIARAAKRLKLLPKIELNKAYPSQWWRKTGRVIVSAKVRKTKIIRQIAIIMKKQKKS
jgi:signal recognition particle subunit SRP19